MNTLKCYTKVSLIFLKVLNEVMNPRIRSNRERVHLNICCDVISHKRNSSLFLQNLFSVSLGTLLRTNIANIVQLRLILSGKLLGLNKFPLLCYLVRGVKSGKSSL